MNVMHATPGLRRLVGVAALVGTALCPSFAQDEAGQTLRGFQVPEYDEDMNMTSQLFGDVATLRADGRVEIQNLKLEYYNDEGDITLRVKSPRCLYNRSSKQAESEADVRITREDLVVTGEGYSFDAENQTFHIQRDAKVVLRNVDLSIESGDSP